MHLDFLQANCSPARPTESASDKSLVRNFFHKKHRLSSKDTKKIMFLYFFSDYCAISYRASLSPSDTFEMLTCERQSSSFKHHRLHEPCHALLAEHHHDLIRAECSTILLPHYPDLVFSKHIDDNFCHFFSYYKNDAFILIFSLANSGTTTTAGNCKTGSSAFPLVGTLGSKTAELSGDLITWTVLPIFVFSLLELK